MMCELCKRPIEHYQPQFDRLTLESGNEVDICPSCIDAFGSWQLRTSVDLFPTKTAKHWAKRGKALPRLKDILCKDHSWYQLTPTKIELIYEPEFDFDKQVFEPQAS